MRQYPGKLLNSFNFLNSFQNFGLIKNFGIVATQWPNDNSEKNAPDLYDCRFRPWYTTSATSPKNLLILLDVSGSMTGMRRRIAKAVVNSILDTLTENDYVNVFNFSDTTELLVGCMEREDTGTPILVQVFLFTLINTKFSIIFFRA